MRKKTLKSCIGWFICLGSTPIAFGHYKKELIRNFMQDIAGPRFTWENLQKAGYYITKARIEPISTQQEAK